MKKETAIKNIIEASLIEFGTKGYALASTNSIYKAAKVSKGAIFLYFNSKAELYYEVFKYYLKEVVEDVSKIKLKETDDVFEKIMEVTFWKMEYFSKRQNISKLLTEAIFSPPEEVADKIMSHIDELTKLSLNNFFKDIDMKRFSSEYTKEDVIRFVEYAINGLQHVVIKEGLTIEYLDSIREDSMRFLKTLLKGMEK